MAAVSTAKARTVAETEDVAMAGYDGNEDQVVRMVASAESQVTETDVVMGQDDEAEDSIMTDGSDLPVCFDVEMGV